MMGIIDMYEETNSYWAFKNEHEIYISDILLCKLNETCYFQH